MSQGRSKGAVGLPVYISAPLRLQKSKWESPKHMGIRSKSGEVGMGQGRSNGAVGRPVYISAPLRLQSSKLYVELGVQVLGVQVVYCWAWFASCIVRVVSGTSGLVIKLHGV